MGAGVRQLTPVIKVTMLWTRHRLKKSEMPNSLPQQDDNNNEQGDLVPVFS